MVPADAGTSARPKTVMAKSSTLDFIAFSFSENIGGGLEKEQRPYDSFREARLRWFQILRKTNNRRKSRSMLPISQRRNRRLFGCRQLLGRQGIGRKRLRHS